MIESVMAAAILGFARLLTGVQARWIGCAPSMTQRIYIANHTSHGDFILLWASLPSDPRRRTRPVAATDYWEQGALRRFLIHRVFHGVLVDRSRASDAQDPIRSMVEALDQGDSLILFPEGTRNLRDELLPFKAGLYHLAKQRPAIEIVPVRIENLNRVLPKGHVVPVPLLCRVVFGVPIGLVADEDKAAFLDRARRAVGDLEGR